MGSKPGLTSTAKQQLYYTWLGLGIIIVSDILHHYFIGRLWLIPYSIGIIATASVIIYYGWIKREISFGRSISTVSGGWAIGASFIWFFLLILTAAGWNN